MQHTHQDAVICSIRQRFWVPSIRALVKKVCNNCQRCKLQSAKPMPPLMGQLPPDRLTPYVRPFSYTGLDYFGPVYVAIGRRREKRWIALFTCLTIQAVHVEIAADLSTDARILCIRNFINRRGVPVRIRIDNGTNFVGADRVIKSVDEFFDHSRIQSELTKHRIEWVFNCPSNPHAGGCWERLVQSVKKIIKQSLNDKAPQVETLRSYLIEAENIVNSRPLTHVPVTIDEEEPLTPNHFLLGTANSTQTPCADEDKMIFRKQWRIAKQLKDYFWKRWIADYLPVLTKRTKWFHKVDPIKVDDLVLICDGELPRHQWCKGRIVKVYPGKDQQVRTADVQTSSGILRRPAAKLAL